MRGLAVALVDDVLEEDRALFRRGHRAERLADRDDVVVDGLGQADDGQAVAVLLQVGGEVGGGGGGVVAADRVEDGDPVIAQSPRGDGERVLALLDEAALHRVGDVGKLDAAVADGRAAMPVEDRGMRARLLVERDALALQKPAIAADIADDLHLRRHLRVALDQRRDRGGEAGGEAPGGQHGDFVLRHFRFRRIAARLAQIMWPAQIIGSDAEIKPAAADSRDFRAP